MRGSHQSRREFLRACLLAGAAAAAPRWLAGAAVSSGPTIWPRAAWSAFAPRLERIRTADTFARLTVHHAGAGVNTNCRREDVVYDLNGILSAHLQNGYGDIGYHFIIDYAGRIWQGRSLACEGAHVSGMNTRNLGVMLLGNFEEQKPSADQLSALCLLTDDLLEKYDIEREEIYGHCDLGQSVCPGRFLYSPFVTQLRRL